MNSIKHIILLCLLAILINCCAGDRYHLTIEDYIPDIDNNSDTTKYKIYFTASVYSSNNQSISTRGAYTPDTVALPEGRVVHIYIYDGDKTPITGIPITFSMLQATADGVIEPTNSEYDIKLSPGTYNFYALSEFNNSSDKTPTFVNSNGAGGLKKGLYNNLDYLWWSYEGLIVSDNESSNVNMLFKHISTNIQLNFEATDGGTITKISDANMQCPNPSGCELQLANGDISASVTLNSGMQNLNFITGANSMYVDLVPFTPPVDSLLIKAAVNVNNTYNAWYDIYIKPPDGGTFEQGISYEYNLHFISSTRTLNAQLVEVKR